MKYTVIPDFKSEAERQLWFIYNADYFTTITRRNMRNERKEFPTRTEALAYANQVLRDDPTARPFMIYAVVNNSDTFVENVIRKE
jgi:hypothetical protein